MIRLLLLKNGRIVLSGTAKEGVPLNKVDEVAAKAVRDGNATYAQISVDGQIWKELKSK